MINYFAIHKNKKAKKAIYSKPYSKTQIKNIEKCYQYFINEIESLNK